MRTFEHFSKGDHICPICGTDEDKETILIPIFGTQDGNNIQAAQVHTECLQNNIMLYPKLEGVPSMILCQCNYNYRPAESSCVGSDGQHIISPSGDNH